MGKIDPKQLDEISEEMIKGMVAYNADPDAFEDTKVDQKAIIAARKKHFPVAKPS